MMGKEIREREQKLAAVKEKREQKKASEVNKTKKLSKRKFEEPELEFNRPHEISGNLRNLKSEGSLLADRFYSLQRRNIMEVTAKQLKYVTSPHNIYCIWNVMFNNHWVVLSVLFHQPQVLLL